MLHHHQTGRPRLATRAEGLDKATTAGQAAARREMYRQATRRLVPGGLLTRTTPGRWRHDDMAAGTQKRNPAADLVEQAEWAIGLRLAAGEDAAAIERDVLPLFEAMLAEVRLACRGGAAAVGALADEAVAETREQGEADVALAVVLTTPETCPSYADRLAVAIREQLEHRAAQARLADALTMRRFRVLQFPARMQVSRATG